MTQNKPLLFPPTLSNRPTLIFLPTSSTALTHSVYFTIIQSLYSTLCRYFFKSYFAKGSGKKLRLRFYGQVFVIFVTKVVKFGLIYHFLKGKIGSKMLTVRHLNFWPLPKLIREKFQNINLLILEHQ